MDSKFIETVGLVTIILVFSVVLGIAVYLIVMGIILVKVKINDRNEIRNKSKAEKMIQKIDSKTVDDITIKKLLKIFNKFPLYIYDCCVCDYSSEYSGLCTKGEEQEETCKKYNEFYLLKEQLKKYINGDITIKDINFESFKKLI